MEPIDLLRILIPLYIIAFVVGVFRRITIYRRGKPRRVAILPALAKVPQRYFVDLHHKVDRDRYSSIMHIATAAGFLVAVTFLCVMLLWPSSLFFRWVGVVASFSMLIGSMLVVWRRVTSKRGYPASRSQGEWARFGLSIAAAAAGFLLWFSSDGESWVATGLLTLSLFEIVVGAAWYSPMRHALVGALNLGFHPRPDRFQDAHGSDTGLLQIDLGAPQLGVAKASDWDWTRTLNFDGCVQCGRCEAACPAFAAGQPLNPKALVHDFLVSSGLSRLSGSYAGNGHPQMPIRLSEGIAEIVPDQVAPETLWSCTTCRACVEECPMMIEHVDAVVDLRRNEVLTKAALPGKGPEVLSNYLAADTPSGRDPARRFDWASGLNLPLLSEIGETDCLLWAGEGAFDARGQRTLRSLVGLLKGAGVTPAILGSEERDCGDLARRLGDEVTFQRMAKRNLATFSKYQIGKIVTSDPHVVHVINAEYRAFGKPPRTFHHSEVLADLIKTEKIRISDRQLKTLTYHDPCYLGRYCGEYDAPRRVLDSLSENVVEMERNRHTSRCCGWGGGATFTDIPGVQRIPDMRMADVAETNAQIVAVACPNCAVMLEGVTEQKAEVVDIAELLAQAVEVRK